MWGEGFDSDSGNEEQPPPKKRRRRKLDNIKSKAIIEDDSSESSSQSQRLRQQPTTIGGDDEKHDDDGDDDGLTRRLDKILATLKREDNKDKEKEEEGDDDDAYEYEDDNIIEEEMEDNDDDDDDFVGMTGEERMDKLKSDACGDGAVLMVSAINLLDYIRCNFPYVILKLQNVVTTYNVAAGTRRHSRSVSSLHELAWKMYFRKNELTYTQFLNEIFLLNSEDQKAIEILLNSTKSWVRQNSNIQKLCRMRKNNSLNGYYIDSIEQVRSIDEYLGNDNRELDSLFWTATSTQNLPSKTNVSAAAFEYSVRAKVEVVTSSSDVGWEELNLTRNNCFFISRFVEEFVYSLVSTVGNVVCVHFQNAEKMGLPKVAYISR